MTTRTIKLPRADGALVSFSFREPRAWPLLDGYPYLCAEVSYAVTREAWPRRTAGA